MRHRDLTHSAYMEKAPAHRDSVLRHVKLLVIRNTSRNDTEDECEVFSVPETLQQ